jgi:hypothetical protein
MTEELNQFTAEDWKNIRRSLWDAELSTGLEEALVYLIDKQIERLNIAKARDFTRRKDFAADLSPLKCRVNELGEYVGDES